MGIILFYSPNFLKTYSNLKLVILRLKLFYSATFRENFTNTLQSETKTSYHNFHRETNNK